MEWNITNGTKYWTGTAWTLTISFAKCYKVRERAERDARKINGTVEVFYGAPRAGTKFFTTGKQSPINRRSAYRNI